MITKKGKLYICRYKEVKVLFNRLHSSRLEGSFHTLEFSQIILQTSYDAGIIIES